MGHGGTGAYLSCYSAIDGVHPGQVSGLSHGWYRDRNQDQDPANMQTPHREARDRPVDLCCSATSTACRHEAVIIRQTVCLSWNKVHTVSVFVCGQQGCGMQFSWWDHLGSSHSEATWKTLKPAAVSRWLSVLADLHYARGQRGLLTQSGNSVLQ